MSSKKERIIEAFKKLNAIRPKVSFETALTIAALILITFIAFTVRMLPLRWGAELSEFDPYFQYRFTEYIVKNGPIAWVNWRDYQRWYPWGYDVGKRAFPGLPMTSAFSYIIVSALSIPISLKDFCVFFPVIAAVLTCIVMYFLGKDFGGKTVGLLSAFFLALSPTYITRTSFGFFDDETVGLLGILLLFLFFLRSLDETKTVKSTIGYGILSGLVLGYVCASWGAALYPTGLILAFTFVLLILRKATQRLLLSYSLTYGLGLFIATQVPKLGLKYLQTWSILPVAGVFVLLCLNEALKRVTTTKWKIIYVIIFLGLIIGGFAALYQLGYVRGIAGKFISVLNPLARKAVPLIESVQEHRVTAWGAIYYEYGVLLFFLLVGLFFAAGNLNYRNIFLIVFGIAGLYFSCSMVRLLILSAPAVALLAAIGVVRLLKPFLTIYKEKARVIKGKAFGLVGKEFSGVTVLICFLLLMANFAYPFPRVFSHAYSPPTILAGSMPLRPTKPVTEWIDALQWMRENLPPDAVVCSWWDYGYWITVYGNRTSVADNATSNSTQIALIGRMFSENETNALKVLETIKNKDFPNPPGYLLVFCTFYYPSEETPEMKQNPEQAYRFIGWGDAGKWIWMVRIAASKPKVQEKFGEIHVEDYYNETTNTPIPAEEGGKYYQSMIYKLMAHARYHVVKTLRPGSNITDPADTEEFKQHYTLIYPITQAQMPSTYYVGRSQNIDYYAIPVIAIYKINY